MHNTSEDDERRQGSRAYAPADTVQKLLVLVLVRISTKQ